MRAYLALNSRFGEAPPRRVELLQELEAQDAARIEPAFHGHPLFVYEGFKGFAQPVALVALPLGHGEVSEVVLAHVSIEKLRGGPFTVDGLVQSALFDRDGVTLAHRDTQRLGRRRRTSPGARGAGAPARGRVAGCASRAGC